MIIVWLFTSHGLEVYHLVWLQFQLNCIIHRKTKNFLSISCVRMDTISYTGDGVLLRKKIFDMASEKKDTKPEKRDISFLKKMILIKSN